MFPTRLTATFSRRHALGVIGALGATVLAACSDSGDSAASTTAPFESSSPTTNGSGVGVTDSSSATPSETGGPFPSDGTNDTGAGSTADIMHDARAVRSDIRSDLDGANTQEGVPFTLRMKVTSAGSSLAGAAVYVWHCNRDGAYSGYSSNMLGGDYSAYSFLRGVQVTDGDGNVEFASILPGRYMGRAFHIHFEVYSDSAFSSKILTSQMAVDDDYIDGVYAQADGYANALRNDTNNSQDNVFSDGVSHQLLTMSGDVSTGLVGDFTAVV